MPRAVRVSLFACASLVLAAVGVVAVGVSAAALAVVYLAVVTPALAATDIREHRLPNVAVLPGIAAGLASCSGEWLATGHPPLVPLIAGAAYAAFLFILNLTGGMGMGDVKLGAALGLASWTPAVAVLGPVVAFLAGGFVAVILLRFGKRGSRIAFGPYLLGGYWVIVGLLAFVKLFP